MLVTPSIRKAGTQPSKQSFNNKSKPADIRISNIQAAKSVSDAIRTSLGPRGMDKMIQSGNGDVSITNDGATILKQIKVTHPAAQMLVELSRAQDVEVGDGTTSVVIIAGGLLSAAEKLLHLGLHPTAIADSFQRCCKKAVIILESMATEVKLNDTEALAKSASTALNSKVVCQESTLLSRIAVNAVLKITEPGREHSVDLKNIKVFQSLGGTVEDTTMIDGLVFDIPCSGDNAPKIIEKAKIALIQFCISAPRANMEQSVIVSDYSAMDRILKEERAYILNIVKQIKKTGCNVLLVQKSILRDAVSDLAQHFLDKIKCLVVKDIDRNDIEFVCKTLKCRPIASLDHFTTENLSYADRVKEFSAGSKKFVKITGIHNPGRTVSIICRGSNKLVLEEAARSLHDALCVVRCLVKKPAEIVGGGSPEIEMSIQLAQLAQTAEGFDAYCFRAFADALEVIPYTLAENAGLNSVATVTELRNRHASGESTVGINVRRGCVTDMLMENVMQPLVVATSAINLATETVCSILKIDDIINKLT